MPDTGEKPQSIAVAVPGGKLFEGLFANGIEPVCAQLGFPLTRLRPDFTKNSALIDHQLALANCTIFIADVSARNPHIMYSLGYAQALKKRIIFLALHAEEFPFDQSVNTVIIHAGNLQFLGSELMRLLRGVSVSGQAPASTFTAPSNDPAFDQFMAHFGDILQEHGYLHTGQVKQENEKTFMLLDQQMDLALVEALARRGRHLGIRLKLM